MHYLSTCMIVAIVLASVRGSPSNCSNTYQQLMDQAAAVKRTCSEATLKDCCQVSAMLHCDMPSHQTVPPTPVPWPIVSR